ncbi:hypothetical protein LTS08_000754 [Lithohypha guttulata]|uniref:uncharacterized protein n=1 Tax=Lithohypha guttulata TaxID=1690604 RepID=UPI002DE1639A|nr:hypothetical protein LTR51_006635 [Lithohypha guttulata]KAK5106633.1 hypothetical protein LTS08_000754 [Lithohypha guttulata]
MSESSKIDRRSRGFGFIRFPSLPAAESFMQANYPIVYIYGENSKGHTSDNAKVRIAYGRERKDTDRVQETDWICKACNINNFSTRLKCFRCQSARPDPATNAKAANIGDNDAAPDNVPSQFLLLRGLDPNVNEDLFAKGVGKLNKPSATGSLPSQPAQKKGKVASTTGDANLGAKEGTLRRILLVRDRKTNESWRYGFAEYATIEDAQAAITRYNSFDRFTIASKTVLVSYIHAGVFVPVHNPSPATKRFSFSPIGNPSVKLQYWDEDAYITELMVNMPDQQSATPKGTAVNPADNEGLKAVPDIDKLKKRKQQLEASTSSKKVTPSHLQFWSNRHAELHGIHQKNNDNPKSDRGSDPGAPPAKSYADPKRSCCYLCMRQFESPAEVNRHERLSDLHRNNLKDEIKVKRAEHKLDKHGVTSSVQASATVDQESQKSEYRDRARERRKIHGVVNKKGEIVGGKNASAKERTPSPPPTAPSKGANLLAKMGYTAGAGLGATGEGMTAPIAQNVYAAGIGLGAQGGKLGDAVEQAERNTKGDYADWVEQGRDKMRERYKNM